MNLRLQYFNFVEDIDFPNYSSLQKLYIKVNLKSRKRMKVVIINKSDSTGGAAIVSRRLMEALRQNGVDARMLVCEKNTDSEYITKPLFNFIIKTKFLLERLKIFIANGFNRATLFKIDTGSEGIDIANHRWVKDADVIMINWVNQGMLSLEGFKKLLKSGKPVIWTMHDMWNMTGICHHAGSCDHYKRECGNCHLLEDKSSPDDLSRRVWQHKDYIYSSPGLMKKTVFVAVSKWLQKKAKESSLLKNQRVEVIPNAFQPFQVRNERRREKDKIRILFGAARLDDPIKGLDTLQHASHILGRRYPALSKKLEIALFGGIKDPERFKDFGLPVISLGILKGEERVADAYCKADILVSASSYETLPGTLVEAQAYGCIPVSFDQGGQQDIIDVEKTGFLVNYDFDITVRASNLAEAIVKACELIGNEKEYEDFLKRMKENVQRKFSYEQIAQRYIELIHSLQ